MQTARATVSNEEERVRGEGKVSDHRGGSRGGPLAQKETGSSSYENKKEHLLEPYQAARPRAMYLTQGGKEAAEEGKKRAFGRAKYLHNPFREVLSEKRESASAVKEAVVARIISGEKMHQLRGKGGAL